MFSGRRDMSEYAKKANDGPGLRSLHNILRDVLDIILVIFPIILYENIKENSLGKILEITLAKPLGKMTKEYLC